MPRTSQSLVAIVALLVLLGMPILEALTARSSDAAAQSGSQPNILVIQTDDMRADDLAAMPKTKALLKAGGMSFDNYIAGGTPLCCPNRATALTGQYPHNHGVLRNGGARGGHGAFVDTGSEQRTIAVALQAAGYWTGYTGKYMNGYPANQPEHIPPGWNEWISFTNDGEKEHGGDGQYYTYNLNENGTILRLGSKPRKYSTDVITGKSLRIIERAPEQQPLFLWVSPFAPHSPAIPAPRDKKADVPTAFQSSSFNQRGQGKASWIRELPRLKDEEIRTVERRNVQRRRSPLAVDDMVETLVVAMPGPSYVFFISDNGYMLGEFRIPYGKIVPYKPAAEVPLLVLGPGIAAGSRSSVVVSSIDLAPTWAAIGDAAMGDVDGRNLLPLLRGDGDLPNPRRNLLLEWSGLTDASLEADLDGDSFHSLRKAKTNAAVPKPLPFVALRAADWLYVEWDEGAGEGTKEYYDHATDPNELNNIYATLSPERQQELTARVGALKTCAGGTCD
ncbi:MAG: sulfatase [Chloroflexota bacterium]|nr:sulfatase [Chloroflexota bacterium]